MAHYLTPEHIFTGRDCFTEAVGYLKQCGQKALLVTGPHVVKSEMFAELSRMLADHGIEFVTFSEITGEPTDVMINAGVSVFLQKSCDYCIGFGGGSPLDAAKAIAVMAANEGSISDFNGKEITKMAGPVVAIPTTAGTGSEATKFTVITDSVNDIKMLLKGDCLIPKIAIVDETFSLSSPQSVTAATGLDALTHAVEAYTSRKAMDMTDTLAVSAVKRIMKYLPVAYRDGKNREARHQMALAVLEAGICINNSSVTLVHGLSRPIGALFHVAHGISNAMLLNACFSFALEGAYERFADLARAIGVADEKQGDIAAAEQFLKAIEHICEVCEVPTLEKYGIPREAFYAAIPKMAQDALDSGSPGNTRKVPAFEDCQEIYKAAYAG